MGGFEQVQYAGWPGCVRFTDGQVELIATTDVGPRIIRYGFINGRNLLKEYTEQLGVSGGSAWRIYGGHRLWHAPESRERTYGPDNEPVQCKMSGSGIRLTQNVEPHTGVQKSIEIHPQEAGRFEVCHLLVNRGKKPIDLAPWALTVMAAGGYAILPQEDYHSQEHHILPARPLVLWPYTDMASPCWSWGTRYIRLRQGTDGIRPQKIGVLNTKGWAAYMLVGTVFIKRFPYLAGANYPDFGCNAETFVNPDMLELESLGPMVTLRPGDETSHTEVWSLHHVEMGETEDEIAAAIEPLVI